MCYNNGMELKQRLALKRLLVPQLQQSLKVLTLSLPDLKAMIDEELVNDPFLEDAPPAFLKPKRAALSDKAMKFQLENLTRKASLQDVLLRQLGMFANNDSELKLGQEIIGNIDENGYLKASLQEIAQAQNATLEQVERTLKLIQQFEPLGVGARNVSECLLIQFTASGENDPLLKTIIENHLDNVAKKNYTLIAKALGTPAQTLEPLLKKISKFDPKPGRNYSGEETKQIIPDIIIECNDEDEELEITINQEDIPNLSINKTYRQMLKDPNLDAQTKQFLSEKLANALELLRAISRRQTTLRRIVETVAEIQQEAIRGDLSCLKPLTFKDVAEKIDMHETTVCRAIMNKYVKLPFAVVALRDFFPSHVHGQFEESVSSNHVKKLIKELIEQEDKKHPLSDQDIHSILTKEKNLNLSRRTIAKYREELKILSTSYRREK
ncbi:MAG: RNA polymerase factor sigma-54 [Candidatus Omnitrophica bacterium]|nr:RNA polymerase factor sigma-54 [Candidatus Omnitrophota bacterium]